MKKLSILFSILVCCVALHAGSDDAMLLKVEVPPINEIGFYANAIGDAQSGDTWKMGDTGDLSNATTAYLIVKTNYNGVLTLSINLPTLKGTDAIVGSALAYSTVISKVGTTSGVEVYDDLGTLKNSPDTETLKDFGTISGANGTNKGVFEFDFSVSSDDYWVAFPGAYETDVKAVMKAS